MCFKAGNVCFRVITKKHLVISKLKKKKEEERDREEEGRKKKGKRRKKAYTIPHIITFLKLKSKATHFHRLT